MVSDAVDELAISIRTDGRRGDGQRIRVTVHFQRDLRIGTRVKPLIGVGQVNLGTHIAGLRIETEGETSYLADERLTVEARGLDDGRIADAKARHVFRTDEEPVQLPHDVHARRW